MWVSTGLLGHWILTYGLRYVFGHVAGKSSKIPKE